METDRLHHFVWEHMENGHEKYAPAFYRFYEELDAFVGELVGQLDDDVALIILSDHGFCTVKSEIYINWWLEEAGYLTYKTSGKKAMSNIDWETTRAFCMDPGRVYINVRGRGAEYNDLQNKLINELKEISISGSDEPIVRNVYTNQELFHGDQAQYGPDLVIDSNWGYDIKGFHGRDALTGKGPINGMHTYEDAMVYIRGQNIVENDPSVIDFLPTVFDLMKLPTPADVDGRSLVSK
jgi:predicted AlkP superfamily phosphohydrolase/phosphomutase